MDFTQAIAIANIPGDNVYKSLNNTIISQK